MYVSDIDNTAKVNKAGMENKGGWKKECVQFKIIRVSLKKENRHLNKNLKKLRQ